MYKCKHTHTVCTQQVESEIVECLDVHTSTQSSVPFQSPSTNLSSVLLFQLKEIPKEKGGSGGRQDKITITITYTPTATAHHKQKEAQDNTKVHKYMNNITKQLEYTDWSDMALKSWLHKMAGQLWLRME